MIIMEKEKTIQTESSSSSTDPAPVAEGAAPASMSEAPATAESSLTPEQIVELQAKAAKADENWDRLLRQAAEFDNFKKRAARDRMDAIKYANQALLDKLIPVLDHFEMALAAGTNAQDNSLESFKTGMAMIQNQLKSVLAESGLEEIEAQNQPFDPNLHEAVSHQESAEAPEGHVLQQLRKGYKLKERLLRPATVVVAKKPSA
jgi:molecular chaperone GrpE